MPYIELVEQSRLNCLSLLRVLSYELPPSLDGGTDAQISGFSRTFIDDTPNSFWLELIFFCRTSV